MSSGSETCLDAYSQKGQISRNVGQMCSNRREKKSTAWYLLKWSRLTHLSILIITNSLSCCGSSPEWNTFKFWLSSQRRMGTLSQRENRSWPKCLLPSQLWTLWNGCQASLAGSRSETAEKRVPYRHGVSLSLPPTEERVSSVGLRRATDRTAQKSSEN